MDFELIFLGTGTSAGVPMIGCNCAVCTSNDPHDKRSRPSVLVRYRKNDRPSDPLPAHEKKESKQDACTIKTDLANFPVIENLDEIWRNFLIDTAPELRQQAIQHNLKRIDGVFYTHAHADHILGIDDLRRFNVVMGQPLDLYAEQPVLDKLENMFSYIFEPHKNINKSFVAKLITNAVDIEKPLKLFEATWTPLRLMHGRLPIAGYRIDCAGKSLAYCTDVSNIPPQTFPLLQNLDVLVIDALRYRHHPTHMTVNQAAQVIEQVKPQKAFLTHLAHDISHAKLSSELPENIQPAYDGFTVTI